MTSVVPVADQPAEAGQFVQYLMLRVDRQWRRLDAATRNAGRAEFVRTVCDASGDVTTFAYSTLGLKSSADLMLWWRAATPEVVQELTGALLCTGLGRYCEIAHSLWGITRDPRLVRAEMVLRLDDDHIPIDQTCLMNRRFKP